MIEFKSDKLMIMNHIQSHDSIIRLYSDIDCYFIGVITLSNNINKTINFTKQNKEYFARLIITEEDLPYLNKCTLHLIVIDGNTQKQSNTVEIKFDIPKIKKTIKLSTSNDIKDIKISIAQLTKRLEDAISKAPSFMVTSNTPINTNYVKPGMIPVAIDETGRCIFQYPFIDHITEINGQKTLNSAILLTAKDIPAGTSSNVETILREHTEAMKSLTAYLDTISTELKTVKNKLADVEQKLLTHTESSLV